MSPYYLHESLTYPVMAQLANPADRSRQTSSAPAFLKFRSVVMIQSMFKKILSLSRHPRRMRFLLSASFGFILAFFISTTHFNFKGRYDGLFLLKGEHGYLFDFTDDIYLGDGDRVICGIDLHDPHYIGYNLLHRRKPGEPYLYYEWDKKDGSGFIRNFLPDGKQLLTCFSRYKDDDGNYVHGLFVGGGLPANVRGDDAVKMNETGMAFFDGKRWYHLWCNVNEGIAASLFSPTISPSRWKFLGGRILNESDSSVVIESRHEVTVNGVPLRIARHAYFTAGEPYFLLTIKITNIGDIAAHYHYLYGDEPWLGNFGSSAGNVGWVKDGLVEYETIVPRKYNFAGLYDYGNSAAGEGRNFTMAANFIEWLGPNKPDAVYFSNQPGVINLDKMGKIPLGSNTRFLGLQWNMQQLAPRKSVTYTLAIGMAGHDPKNGFPVKPEIRLN